MCGQPFRLAAVVCGVAVSGATWSDMFCLPPPSFSSPADADANVVVVAPRAGALVVSTGIARHPVQGERQPEVGISVLPAGIRSCARRIAKAA